MKKKLEVEESFVASFMKEDGRENNADDEGTSADSAGGSKGTEWDTCADSTSTSGSHDAKKSTNKTLLDEDLGIIPLLCSIFRRLLVAKSGGLYFLRLLHHLFLLRCEVIFHLVLLHPMLFITILNLLLCILLNDAYPIIGTLSGIIGCRFSPSSFSHRPNPENVCTTSNARPSRYLPVSLVTRNMITNIKKHQSITAALVRTISLNPAPGTGDDRERHVIVMVLCFCMHVSSFRGWVGG